MAEKIGISLDKETLQLCDKYAAKHSRSRSEFIAAAIQNYVSDLELDIIAQELAGEIIKGSEAGVTKISKGLFRYAVEMEMLIELLADMLKVTPQQLEIIRKNAINNCRRTRGKINLEDLISRNRRDGLENYEEDIDYENA